MRIASNHRHEPDDHHARLAPPLPPPLLVFDRKAVREIDRLAIERYGVPGIVLMENAAQGLLREALALLKRPSRRAKRVLIICGSGNNGGDGYALARGLHNAGIEVTLAPISQPLPSSDAGINCAICRRLELPEISIDELDQYNRQARPELIVDAIFGTGLDRPITGRAADVVRWINDSKRPVLAVDVPSGLDCDTGRPVGDPSAVVQATKTVTFVGLKAGFIELDAQWYLGDVVVVDIGAPIELLEQLGRRVQTPHPESPEHPELNAFADEEPLSRIH